MSRKKVQSPLLKLIAVLLILFSTQIACNLLEPTEDEHMELQYWLRPWKFAFHKLENEEEERKSREHLATCQVGEEEVTITVQEPKKATSFYGDKTKCSSRVTLTAPKKYSVVVARCTLSNMGGQGEGESCKWSSGWQPVEAGTTEEIGRIYWAQYNDGKSTEIKFDVLDKITIIKDTPKCDMAEVHLAQTKFQVNLEYVIDIPNPCP